MRSTSTWNPNDLASDLTGPTAGISRRQPPPPASSASTTLNPSSIPNVSGRTDVAKKKSSTPTTSGRGIRVGKSLSSKNGISVEYYFTSSGVWTHRAVLTLSKTKNKLYLDILDPQPPSRRWDFFCYFHNTYYIHVGESESSARNEQDSVVAKIYQNESENLCLHLFLGNDQLTKMTDNTWNLFTFYCCICMRSHKICKYQLKLWWGWVNGWLGAYKLKI